MKRAKCDFANSEILSKEQNFCKRIFKEMISNLYREKSVHFTGIREGGVSNNTAYYVFTHAEDGAIEAFPLQEW